MMCLDAGFGLFFWTIDKQPHSMSTIGKGVGCSYPGSGPSSDAIMINDISVIDHMSVRTIDRYRIFRGWRDQLDLLTLRSRCHSLGFHDQVGTPGAGEQVIRAEHGLSTRRAAGGYEPVQVSLLRPFGAPITGVGHVGK